MFIPGALITSAPPTHTTKRSDRFTSPVLLLCTGGYDSTHGTSLLKTAAIFNIATPSTLRSWKKQVETKEFDAFQSKKKGRPSMKKEKNK